MPENIRNPNSPANPNGTAEKGELTPESIKKITEMVYRLFMDDLKVERERTMLGSKSNLSGGR